MIRRLIDRLHDWTGDKIAELAGTDVHPQEWDTEAELRDFIRRDARAKRRDDQ